MPFSASLKFLIILAYHTLLILASGKTKSEYYHLHTSNISTGSFISSQEGVDKIECSLLCSRTKGCKRSAVTEEKGRSTCYLIPNKTNENDGKLVEAHVMDLLDCSKAVSCRDLRGKCSSARNGKYEFEKFSAYCDMETDGGRSLKIK